MGTAELGKWGWIIGLGLLVLGGIVGAFGNNFVTGILLDVAVTLAFLGGILHLASSDRTAFFIATAALVAVSGGMAAGSLFVPVLGALVDGILAGAATAATAGTAGILLMAVYEWVMP